RDLVERLARTGFVVDEHHRDDRRTFVDRGPQGVEVDDAGRSAWYPGDAEAFTFEPRARSEHRLVLDPAGEDAVELRRARAGGVCRALSREVVALAAPAREHHFMRPATALGGNDFTGFFECGLGLPRGRVPARRIGGVIREEREQRRDRLRTHGRRSRVVEIGRHASRVRPAKREQDLRPRRSGPTEGVVVTPSGDTATMSERSRAPKETGDSQLRLLPGASVSVPPDWKLDERTRNVGRVGVAQA